MASAANLQRDHRSHRIMGGASWYTGSAEGIVEPLVSKVWAGTKLGLCSGRSFQAACQVAATQHADVHEGRLLSPVEHHCGRT